MATKMIDMGVKRKEMHATEMPSSPASEKDYQNEKKYPELSLSGAHAEMMGAEDLKAGDIIEQTVRWRVKDHSVTTENGKTDYRMTLCLEKGSDCVDCGSEDGEDDDDEGAGKKSGKGSAAMAYIMGNAKSED